MSPPRKPPPPYRTKTPWHGFTQHEFSRDKPLPRCPSPACRRAKACIAAYKELFCLRTHETLTARRRRLHATPAVKSAAPAPHMSHKQAQMLGHYYRLRLDEVQERDAELTRRWKEGEFDALYGPWTPNGVMKHPPPRDYVE